MDLFPKVESKFVYAHWCGDAEVEKQIKDETGGVTIRNLPFLPDGDPLLEPGTNAARRRRVCPMRPAAATGTRPAASLAGGSGLQPPDVLVLDPAFLAKEFCFHAIPRKVKINTTLNCERILLN